MKPSRTAHTFAVSAAIIMFAGCDASRRDWDAARATNTRQSYERFLEQHPKSELAEGARAAIAGIAAAEEGRRRQLAEAEARKKRAAAALEIAKRHETIPAYRRVAREFEGTPEGDEARRAIVELRTGRRAEAREVERVAVIVSAPPALADVAIADAAREILALAGAESVSSPEGADATLHISLRESSQTAPYRFGGDSSEKTVHLPTSATVSGELRYELRGGARFSRPFSGRVQTPFGVMVRDVSAKHEPPYVEAAGLGQASRSASGSRRDRAVIQVSRLDDIAEPAATFSVRLVHLTAELFGPAVQRAALIEPSDFRWAVLRSTRARGNARTVDALVEILPEAGSDHAFVVEALGHSGDARAVPALLAALKREPHSWEVMQALARLRDRRAVLPLVELLEGHTKPTEPGKRRRDPEPGDPDYDPTVSQIVTTLEQISGRDFGTNAAAWRKWAEQNAAR